MKIVEFIKTKNRYEVIKEDKITLKNSETRNWVEAVVYRDYEKYDNINNRYEKVKEADKKIYVREKTEFYNKFKIVYPNKKATMFYGMSGTFKATLIKKILEDDNINNFPIWSMIKPWKRLENNLLKDKLGKDSHINYTALHLTFLKAFNTEQFSNKNLLIERGVSDTLFYYNRKELENPIKEGEIFKIIEEEKDLLKNRDIEKILLIQNDENFIKNVILKEETRRGQFSTLEDYLKGQNDYVEFSKKYNNFTEIIYINNVQEFLNSKGIKYIKE